MTARTHRRPRPPLDQAQLDELALSYVAKFATTRSKLASYLARKVRERGWEGAAAPDFAALVERFTRSGLVDDSAFALAKASSLGRRGYGEARVRQQLRAAGIADDNCADALHLAARNRIANALRFAERRCFGPFASAPVDPAMHRKQVAAMIRAGHPLGVALAILRLPIGCSPDLEQLADNFSHTCE